MATERTTTTRTKRTGTAASKSTASGAKSTTSTTRRANTGGSAPTASAASKPGPDPRRDQHDQRSEVRRPLYAYVGAADLAVEKLRALPATASTEVRRISDRVGVLTGEAAKVPTQVGTTVRALPETVGAQLSGLQDRAAQLYNAWADRGEKRVTEIRRNPATEDAVVRTRTAVSRTKAASTSARRAADAVSRAAVSQAPIPRRSR
jgi:ElaB/YqjD/DUF883 family membrane-anchored ribosome-binding protein